MISERIRELMRQKGWKIADLQRAVNKLPGSKLHQSQLSRMLKGDRPWHLPHLQLVAMGLGVQLGDLVDQFTDLPILSTISAQEKSSYPKIGGEILGTIPALRLRSGENMRDLYGLIVKDSSYEPIIPQGTRLVIQKDGDRKDGDLVVYCDHENNLILGRIQMHDDMFLLKSISGLQKDLILPMRQLSATDKVLAQFHS